MFRLLLVILASLLIFISCNENSGDNQPGKPAAIQGQAADSQLPGKNAIPVEAVTFSFIGDFAGFQRPCGCAVAQYGGLPRLGTIVEQINQAAAEGDSEPVTLMGHALPRPALSAKALWLVDCGNFTDPGMLYPELRAATHLNSIREAGAVCAVIGANELQLSKETAVQVFEPASLPIVSCNVQVVDGSIIVSKFHSPAPNWAIIGLTHIPEGMDQQADWWTYMDPVASVNSALSEIRPGTNTVVVALDQPVAVLQELARLDVLAVIGGTDTLGSEATGSAARVPQPPGRGTILQLLSVDPSAENRVIPWTLESDENWPDDPRILEVIATERAERKARLKQDMAQMWGEGGYENIEWGMSSEYLPAGSDPNAPPYYVGSQSCAPCHSDAMATWQDSAHSHAYESLVAAGENETLDCLQCHTTGLYHRGGFDLFHPNVSAQAVGCESCHGPGSRHVGNMSSATDEIAKLEITRGNVSDCLVCHDDYNSPAFDPEKYWGSIKH